MQRDYAMDESEIQRKDTVETEHPARLNPATQEHSTDEDVAVHHPGAAGGTWTSWRVEVMADDSGEWEGDPFRFETWREALAYARDLELRWSAVRDRRIVRSEEPVNYSWPQCGERAGEGACARDDV
jgi:hypothetical protein